MIGYLGPEGSFTQLALLEYLKKYNLTSNIKPLQTITHIIEELNSHKINSGLVPIENSIEGSVGETLDQLMKSSQQVTINSEIIIPIEHCLITRSKDLNNIKKVIAHIQALNQCQSYIKRFLPNVEIESTSSNSLAVKTISESSDHHLAAIGPHIAAEIYKVPVFEKGVNDEKENYTRFVLVGTETPSKTGNDKTTIAFGIPASKPGTLVGVLQAFAKEKINLTRIESRPSKKMLGEYIFFIELQGHKEDNNFKSALSQVAPEFSFYRWLGSYPCW